MTNEPMDPTPLADTTSLADALIAREPGALPETIRCACSPIEEERARARTAIERWIRRTGKSARIGLTGAGQRAADAFATRLVERGHRVAVLWIGTGGSAEEHIDRFDIVLPDALAATPGILACEISGFDTLLVIADAHSAKLAQRVDCLVSFDEPASGDVVVAAPDANSPDELWTAIERYRWDAVEDGTFAMRREAQRTLV